MWVLGLLLLIGFWLFLIYLFFQYWFVTVPIASILGWLWIREVEKEGKHGASFKNG